MFGTIKPCKKSFSDEMRAEYKKYYCGLCFAMDKNFGKYARFLVNYDLTNDYLLSASVRDDIQECEGRCPWSWRRKKVRYAVCDPLSDYYARLNFLFVYHKLLDDIKDENSRRAKLAVKKMAAGIERIDGEMEREKRLLEEYLEMLHSIEEKNLKTPVENVAALFGKLLENMVKPDFLCDEDEDVFSKINYWTGVWIYTVDAVNDCAADSIKKRYNPITAGFEGDALSIMKARKEEVLGILKKSRSNILQLLELYPTYRNRDVLTGLFNTPLPKLICMNLEVKEDEFAFKG